MIRIKLSKEDNISLASVKDIAGISLGIGSSLNKYDDKQMYL